MATTKQFGLSGISNDVQLGKAGGRLVFATDFKATGTDGSTLVNLQAAAPSLGDHVATKTYVDALSSGLDPKESVVVATTAAITLSGAQTIDGILLTVGNRVLVKDQAVLADNGIYTVESGAWVRATDSDGTPASEVSAGNYTFVEQGTVNENSGWVLQGTGIITPAVGAQSWTQFSGAGSIDAGAGLTKTGNVFNVDLFDADGTPSIPAVGVADAADLMFVGDQDGAVTGQRAIGAVLNDLNVPQFPAFVASAAMVRTADDVYIESITSASVAASEEGIVYAGTPAAPTIGLDINGLTAAGAVTGAFELAAFDGVNNRKVSVTDIISGADLVSAADALTGLVSISSGVLTQATISASVAANQTGIIVNGGTTSSPTIGLNINGLSALGTTLELTDTFAAYDGSASTNAKATMQDIVDLVALSGSDNEISNGTSSVSIAAAGGDVVTTVGGTVVSTVSAAGTTFNSVTVGDLTATEVVYAGTAGSLDSDAGFTYTQGTATLSATNISAATSLTAASATVSNLTDNRITFAGGAGLLEDSADLTFDGTNLIVGGTAGLTVAGNSTVTGTLTSTAGLVSSNLSVAGGVTFSDAAGVLTEEVAFVYDTATNTLSVDNMAVTTGVDFGNIHIEGNTISSTDTNGNIIIAPNGTGEVIIGTAGAAAQLVAEADQDLTVAGGAGTVTGGGDLNLLAGDGAAALPGGNVVIAAGDSVSGTEGTTQLIDANDNLVAEVINTVAGQTESISLAANAIIAAQGTATNVDITLDPKGTGSVLVADAATYDANIVNASLTTKAYVDSAVAGAANPGTIGSVTATIDYTSATTQAIGTIPAGAIVTEVKILNGTASNAVTTVNIGDATNGAAAYMTDGENDAQSTGIFVADAFVAIAADVTCNATVAAQGTVGSATVIVMYMNA